MFDPKDQNISTGNRLPFLFFVDTNYGQDYGNGGLVNTNDLMRIDPKMALRCPNLTTKLFFDSVGVSYRKETEILHSQSPQQRMSNHSAT